MNPNTVQQWPLGLFGGGRLERGLLLYLLLGSWSMCVPLLRQEALLARELLYYLEAQDPTILQAVMLKDRTRASGLGIRGSEVLFEG